MSKLHGRENDTVAVEAATPKSGVALREEAILAFWQDNDIFNKSLITPAGAEPRGEFVFYDGPPFATGLPHYGHILASTIKDAIPRFWTMQGFSVRRKWGWDCHGLPLENLIEKQLGLATKRDIEDYGVKNFNEAARGAVMEYADEWKKVIPRLGRWADMEDDYKTMDSTYTESVWWVFKQLHEKGLVSEGYKAMHLCPRCGTTLSNFEVNQGYKDIKDIAVTVKLVLLDEAGEATDTSLLVWTTTPWTLPGNMAAAVNSEFEYVKVSATIDNVTEQYILAKGRLAQLGDVPYTVVETIKGAELVGLSYQPPFDYWQKQEFEGKANAWKIWHAEYVEIGEEGTGAVHIAPAYGEEDMQLAKVSGVPIVHHVDSNGHFMDFVTDFASELVKPKDDEASGVDHKDTDIKILKALQASGKIFKKENITHSYPHCWRCDTPLLNYATTSWFVNVPAIKDKLVAANDAVHWVPEHVGTSRFGKWLDGARDWAISRQRYWGAPLPIWKNPESGEYKVIGSLDELQKHVKKSGNTYRVMRHGEAVSNLTATIVTKVDTEDSLTDKGRAQVRVSAESLIDSGIDMIVASPFMRTHETAKIVREVLGLSEEALIVDERLREIHVGEALQGKKWSEYADSYSSFEAEYTTHIEGISENRRDVQRRAGEVLYEYETKYQGKNILFIGHNSSTFGLASAALGVSYEDAHDFKQGFWLDNAEMREIAFTPYPHNDNFELDYHRPYIDDIDLYDGEIKMERVLDVFDCWFESGSMPYAQHHYPFENEADFEKSSFPAQFIAEGLDQTRGWFYSLIVLGTALFGKSPYENVIVNGLIMAEDGKKLSKKLQNYSAPTDLVNKVGADAVRLYLLSSPVVHGEDINFSDKEVGELQRKNIGRLHNVLAMYDLYVDGTESRSDSVHVLDRWILARLNQLIIDVTSGYKSYELDKATRPIGDFIDDLSVWYLRRSRDRFKGDDLDDKQQAIGTLRFVLRELAKVMAPAMPFYSEYLYRAVCNEVEGESVHLAAWPEGGEIDINLLTEMAETREVVTAALEARTKAGVKVRQPLSQLVVKAELSKEMAEIVADEINVKEVISDKNAVVLAVLNTTITPELKAEGDMREFMRAVQEMRKEKGLQPADQVVLSIDTNEPGRALLEQFAELIQKTVGAKEFRFATTEGKEVTAGEQRFVVRLD